MCGISGAVQPLEVAVDHVPLIEKIVEDQHSRGPDNAAIQGIASSALRAVFGHNRLAIIDLTANANQPMWDPSGALCLIYNGEIYNYVELRDELRALGHRFRSESDSEVILEAYRAWGDAAFQRFNGPFAFALFDVNADRVLLVRDRFGVKPLFYSMTKDRVVFASTAAACGQVLGLAPSAAYIARGLAHGIYDDDALAPFTGLAAVPSGGVVSITSDTGRIRITQKPFYDLHERVGTMIEELADEPVGLLIDRLKFLIDDAINIRFRADVPVAISHSVGLDSTSIAARANRNQGAVVGFTFGDPMDRRDEGATVRDFTTTEGIPVNFVSPSDADVSAAFVRTVRAQGAPFNSASVIAQFLLYEHVAQAGVRVLMGGQGGDETLMGYRKFQLFQITDAIAHRQYGSAFNLVPGLMKMLLAELPQARTYAKTLYRYREGSITPALLPATVGPSPHPLKGSERLWERQVRDVMSTSLPSLLRYEDRNSMAHSVESRLPFLDYRLVELAIALPTSMKIRDGYGKWVLREAMRDQVPQAIRGARNKRGFDVPYARWIGHGLGHAIRDALRERRSEIEARTSKRLDEDSAFSDRRLLGSPTAFPEATALVWIAGHPPSETEAM
jgi:asparagine synthase (glutamine-hydrolysing)